MNRVLPQVCGFFLVLLLAGCADFPIQKNSAVGRYSYPLGFNYGGSIDLQANGHYIWSADFFYCMPLVVVDDQGRTTESILGWTNQEEGTWSIHDGALLLNKESRHIENPNCEASNFETCRHILVKRRPSGRVVLIMTDLIPERRIIDETGTKATGLPVEATRH